MAIFDTTEHIQTAKPAGKDHLIPSPTEAKDAQAYFDDIIKNEKQNSNLPNVAFNVVPRKANAENSYYTLQELSTDGLGVKHVVEIGRFQEYTNGLTAEHSLEHTKTADGKKILRETEDVSTTDAKSSQVFEAADDGLPQVRKEMHRKVSHLKDGNETDWVTLNFGYDEKTGKKNAETIESHKPDGTTITQAWGGDDKLKLKSEIDTGPDGKESARATIVDVINEKKEVTGRRETVVQHKSGNTTTTIFEGPDDDNLKAVEQTIAYDNGKTETYKPDRDGHLKLVNKS